MLRGERVAVAGETFCAIESDPLFGRRRRMRIVTRRAGHFVARLALADALPQRLRLAERTNLMRFGIHVDVVMDVVAKVVAWTIVSEFAVRLLDGYVAFEVTLHADVVAARGSELGWIDDVALAGSDVGWAVAMAALACDTVVGEERHLVFVFGAGVRRSRRAGMAIEAATIRRQIHRHEARILKGRRSVPDFFLRIPIDGRFEEE